MKVTWEAGDIVAGRFIRNPHDGTNYYVIRQNSFGQFWLLSKRWGTATAWSEDNGPVAAEKVAEYLNAQEYLPTLAALETE